MTRLVSVLASTAMLVVATPAGAQAMGGMPMNMPGMKMSAPAKRKPIKANARTKAATWIPAKRATRRPATARSSSIRGISGMGHGAVSGMAMSGAATAGQKSRQGLAGMQMPMAPQAGHDMVGMTMQGDQPAHDMQGMAGMPGMSGTAMEGIAPTGTALPAGDAPPPPVPTDHAADRVYGADAMMMGRHHLQHHHGGSAFYQVMFNLAEYQFRNGRDGYRWDGQAWYGGDINRLFVKTEGEGTLRRGVDSAEVQALYSRAIGPYFNLQAGVREDLGPSPKRTYATVGLEGLATGQFELSGAAFLSNKGELLGRLEGYYDQRVTQRLILQPRVELNVSAQDVPANRIGSGLSNAELGLRLRYEIRREFAPYVGVSWDRKVGDTARFARAAGEDATARSIVAGARVWF